MTAYSISSSLISLTIIFFALFQLVKLADISDASFESADFDDDIEHNVEAPSETYYYYVEDDNIPHKDKDPSFFSSLLDKIVNDTFKNNKSKTSGASIRLYKEEIFSPNDENSNDYLEQDTGMENEDHMEMVLNNKFAPIKVDDENTGTLNMTLLNKLTQTNVTMATPIGILRNTTTPTSNIISTKNLPKTEITTPPMSNLDDYDEQPTPKPSQSSFFRGCFNSSSRASCFAKFFAAIFACVFLLGCIIAVLILIFRKRMEINTLKKTSSVKSNNVNQKLLDFNDL